MQQTVPTDTLEQARLILRVWQEKDINMVFGKMTLTDFLNALTEADQGEADVESALAMVESKRDLRNDKKVIVWDNVKRARSGFKSTFGDDSNEYERVGGTRASDRKKPKPKDKSG